MAGKVRRSHRAAIAGVKFLPLSTKISENILARRSQLWVNSAAVILLLPWNSFALFGAAADIKGRIPDPEGPP
jgi:hypothetical protein